VVFLILILITLTKRSLHTNNQSHQHKSNSDPNNQQKHVCVKSQKSRNNQITVKDKLLEENKRIKLFSNIIKATNYGLTLISADCRLVTMTDWKQYTEKLPQNLHCSSNEKTNLNFLCIQQMKTQCNQFHSAQKKSTTSTVQAAWGYCNIMLLLSENVTDEQLFNWRM